jgi:hypothetical protein
MSPLTGTAATAGDLLPASPFAGIDICRGAGLALPRKQPGPSSRTTSGTSPT